MPDLAQSLRDFDLTHLQNIAELWGIEMRAPDARRAADLLVHALLDSQLISEIIEALPAKAHQALEDLQAQNGRMEWSQFSRKFGKVREMGTGRQARQKPHRNPKSTSEILWYRALIARAFFDTPSGPQEFVYIPDDLLALMPKPQGKKVEPWETPASVRERAKITPVTDHVLDAACTLLAALRTEMEPDKIEAAAENWACSAQTLITLLSAANLLDSNSIPSPDATRTFLEADRGAALMLLAQAWIQSVDFDDLLLISYLEAEGEWEHNPLQTRQIVLGFLNELPSGEWWSLPAFIEAVYKNQPDFQRTAGDYDSWYLRDKRSGDYLRGFENWYAVDGELLRQIITGPLHWLGILDLAAPKKDTPPTAFRLSAWGAALLEGEIPTGFVDEQAKLQIDSKARVLAPRLLPRAARYQLARFCEWEEQHKDDFQYHITPASLERARGQGLTVNQLQTLLQRHSKDPLPPNILQALKRWDKHGSQARLENVLVLRLKSPKIMEALRASKASRFLGDPIGPTTVVVKTGAWEKVLDALAEMGYLGEVNTLDTGI
ncbi:MAG: hypothetical protein FVQ83_12740 [Chloroflexi bacterium]|nr:hypothetical protein [Chloroflexota bacterium]